MDLKNILSKYDKLEADLLYNKAVGLFNLVTDSEIENLLKCAPENNILLNLSNKPVNEIKQDKILLQDAIDLFIRTIESRKLTEDEFNAMTLDDIKEYMNKLITDKRTILLGVVNRLEDIYRNSGV